MKTGIDIAKENEAKAFTDTPQGECISCWQLSFTERVRILFTGKLWVSLMTFNKPLTPSFFSTKKSDVLAPSPPQTEH